MQEASTCRRDARHQNHCGGRLSMAYDLGELRGLLQRFTLNDSNTFLLADALGDIHGGSDGLFTNDTRMLSRFELDIAGHPPSLLGTAINQAIRCSLRISRIGHCLRRAKVPFRMA